MPPRPASLRWWNRRCWRGDRDHESGKADGSATATREAGSSAQTRHVEGSHRNPCNFDDPLPPEIARARYTDARGERRRPATSPLPPIRVKITAQVQTKITRMGSYTLAGFLKTCRPTKRRSTPSPSTRESISMLRTRLLGFRGIRRLSNARPTRNQTTTTPIRKKTSSVSKPRIDRGIQSKAGPNISGSRSLNSSAGALSPQQINRWVGT